MQDPVHLWISAAVVLLIAYAAAAANDAQASRQVADFGIELAIEDVCAWPNVTLLDDGTLVAAIFNQPNHGRSEGSVELWASSDQGRTWTLRSTPAPHEPQTNRMNVAVGLANNGELILMSSGWSNRYPQGQSGAPFRSAVIEPWVCRSSDGGHTWSIDKSALPAVSPCGGPVIPYGDITPGPNGDLLVSTTSWQTGPDGGRSHLVYIYRSSDDGKSWGEPVLVAEPSAQDLPGAEAAIFHAGDGRWLSAVRAIDGIALFASDDDGRSWRYQAHVERVVEGTPRYRLTPADFLRLADGRIMLAYGDRRDDQPGGRGIKLQISADQGQTWSPPKRLADFAGDGGYPSCVQLPGGQVVIAFYAEGSAVHDRYHMAVATWDPGELPDFGLMLNDDGDRTFFTDPPRNKAEIEAEEAEADLRAMIRSLEGTGVKTLMYSIASGSDVTFYPSRVASPWGWRETDYYNKIGLESGVRQVARNIAAMRAGLEPLRIVGEEAKRLGLYYFLTLRINDAHFVGAPEEHPLTGRFWMENHQTLTLGTPPLAETRLYGRLFDFSHEAVRDYRFEMIAEVVDLYGDLIDGVELDFMRHPYLFPPGTARERAPLLTELIERIRRKLDEASQREGRPFYFAVRVPPTLKNCHWVGIDIEQWIERRLVDVVVVSQQMTLSHDMPVEQFVELARPVGCRVYAAMFPRAQFTWPFVQEPGDELYSRDASRIASAALIRGAVQNYRVHGIDGFQMYNFNIPLSPIANAQAHVMAGLDQTADEMVFTVTPAYYLDYLDAHEYPKQVPAPLRPKEPVIFRLLVGADRVSLAEARYIGLRIGLRGPVNAQTALRIACNGQALHDGPLGELLIHVRGDGGSSRFHSPPTQAFVQLPMDAGMLRQQINNGVYIELISDESEEEILVTEVSLGVLPSHGQGGPGRD